MFESSLGIHVGGPLTSRKPPASSAVIAALLALTTCADEPLRQAPCGGDADCEAGTLCEYGECVPESAFHCDAVIGGRAILQAEPHVVWFDSIGAAAQSRSVVLRNIGDCVLTLFEASLDAPESSPFACASCDPSSFPAEIFPFREHAIELGFSPGAIGAFSAGLVLLSDDADYPELTVPVHVHYDGAPTLVASPNPVSFDYVAVGRAGRRSLTLVNGGTGIAPLEITGLTIESASGDTFEIETLPATPVELVPLATAPTSTVRLTLLYHPRDVGAHAGELVVGLAGEASARIPLSGSSETPPAIAVSPSPVVFGDVVMGATRRHALTVLNEGGSPLFVTYRWRDDSSTDLSALPALLPPIAPGQFVEMELSATATAAADILGTLIFESNDPTRPALSVPVSAAGQPQAGLQVVKIELNFENGSDSVFDDDFRDVDLTLEHPYGFFCNEAQPEQEWNELGQASWMSLGPKEEPERIILVGPEGDARYRVMLQYAEDCSFLPTELLASVLGIGIDLLLQYLSGGALNPESGDIAAAIDSACLSHSGTAATVTIWVNGTLTGEQTVPLGSKGEFLYAADLVRSGGVFTVE